MSMRIPRGGRRAAALALALAGAVVITGAVGVTIARGNAGNATAGNATAGGIHKIKHVVVIMQENRSFDNYFGTYPGANGIPMKNGVPTVCNVNPKNKVCVKPYHDRTAVDLGGPHTATDLGAQVDGGKMDNFINRIQGWQLNLYPSAPGCGDQFRPVCTGGQPPDVMGYHTRSDLPNYWSYADNFVLHDRMFAPVSSYSLPTHLYMVSGWSAVCSKSNVVASCRNNIAAFNVILPTGAGKRVPTPNYAWTDLTYLLNKGKVSWKYYVADGTGPYCSNNPVNGSTCITTAQTSAKGTPQLWNVLPYFTTVQSNHQLGNIQTLDHFYADARGGHLPAVSWINPDAATSEHPAARLTTGQTYVTGLINALMKSRD